MRGKGVAPAVHPAHPVRIAVRDEAKVMWVSAQVSLSYVVIFLNRFRIDAPEQGVLRPVERRYPAGRAREQLFEASRPTPNSAS